MNSKEATSAIEAGDFKKAIKILSKLLEQEETNIQFLALRGIAFRKDKQLVNALADFDRALDLEPNNADLYSEKGVTLFHANNAFDALTAMNKAVELEPKNPYRYSSRAFIKDALKDIDGAISDYNKAIELDPEDAVALNNLGMLEEKKGNIKKANQHFQASDKIEGVDYSKIDFNKEAQKNGGSAIDQIDGKKEVLNLSQQQNNKKKEVQITETPPPSFWKIIAGVFSSKKEFKEFLLFIQGLFKRK